MNVNIIRSAPVKPPVEKLMVELTPHEAKYIMAFTGNSIAGTGHLREINSGIFNALHKVLKSNHLYNLPDISERHVVITLPGKNSDLRDLDEAYSFKD